MNRLPPKPVVTTITCTYNRPQLLRVTVESLRTQTYPYLEIIVIKNGCTPDSETSRYLERVASEDPRLIIIDYPEQQFSIDDPQKMMDCMNDAMQKVATGDLVFPIDDDDFVSDDHLEKMVRLFVDNPACTTAAGLPLYVDAAGQVKPGARELALARNNRPRYCPGHVLVADFALNEPPTMWSASTFVFVIRRDEYIRAGGILRGEHFASLYGVVPFGITGFDGTAFLYNRDHATRLNRKLISLGNDAAYHVIEALSTMKVEERWAARFGEESARRVVGAAIERVFRKMAMHAEGFYERGSLDAAARQLERCLLVRPDAVEIHRRMGDICLRKWRVRDAGRHYRRCLAGDSLARLWQMMAMRFVLAGASALRTSSVVRVSGSLTKKLLGRVLHGSQAEAA